MPRIQKGQAEVGVEAGVAGSARQRLPDQRQFEIPLAELSHGPPETVEQVRIVGILLEGRLVSGRGFRQPVARACRDLVGHRASPVTGARGSRLGSQVWPTSSRRAQASLLRHQDTIVAYFTGRSARPRAR